VPFILDTGSQFNVISCAVLEKLQLKFPDIDIVRRADFSVGMANQTTAPVLGITKAIDVMITSGAAGPLRLGGIEFVVVEGTSDLLLLGHSTMIERLGIDVEAILSSSTSSNIPAASWVQFKEIKPNSTESIDSLQAAHGNEPESGIEKATKAGLEGEALEIVKKAVFVDSIDCFRAGIREDDPPADVPAMCVRLNPGPVPPHARPRSAAPEKAKFLKKIVGTLADAGMVVTALGASFASPAMAVVKPSSIKAPNVSENGPGIDAGGSPSPQKKAIKYRLVIDYSVINASTVP
ncbi:unnamed protein product, partial [Scytosiphon promiscuus]